MSGAAKGRWAVFQIALVLGACTSSAPTAPRTTSPAASLPPSHTSPPASATPSAGSSGSLSLTGRIVFSKDDDIFVIRPDGSGLQRLTSGPGAEFDPSWSPDGDRIAYRDSRRGINDDDEIYVMNTDGSGQANVTRNPANEWGPAWSPDGKHIGFNSDREGIPQIFVMNPDGSGVTRLTSVESEYPAWSPDGTRIAFMGQAGQAGGSGSPGYEIFVMNRDGSGLARLTTAPGEDGWPAWSRDGTTIAFSSTRDDHGQLGPDGPLFDIYVMNANGSNQRRVTERFGQFVTWSPDGAFILVSPGGYVVRKDGSDQSAIPASRPGGGLAFAEWLP